MKLKDFLGKVVKNKTNKQEGTTFKKRKLKEIGKTSDDLLDMDIDFKLKKIMFEN